jgi:hypothetical protein
MISPSVPALGGCKECRGPIIIDDGARETASRPGDQAGRRVVAAIGERRLQQCDMPRAGMRGPTLGGIGVEGPGPSSTPGNGATGGGIDRHGRGLADSRI